MPPLCLTMRLALLNLATLAMVSAARHFSSRFCESRICTSVGRPKQQTLDSNLRDKNTKVDNRWGLLHKGKGLLYGFTSKVHNGFACLVILRDLSENPEGTNLALEVICLKHVDEEVQSPRVPDGQLGGLLTKVKVHYGAQCNHCCCLVTTLHQNVIK